jgi:hypothetical protein
MDAARQRSYIETESCNSNQQEPYMNLNLSKALFAITLMTNMSAFAQSLNKQNSASKIQSAGQSVSEVASLLAVGIFVKIALKSFVTT